MTNQESELSTEAAVREVLNGLSDPWDRGDGPGYASVFTDEASYVTIDGTTYRGRADIARGHQDIFDTFFKGSTLHGHVLDVRFVAPDVAVALRTGSVQTAEQPQPPSPESVQTFVVVKQDRDWKIAAFQNTTLGGAQ